MCAAKGEVDERRDVVVALLAKSFQFIQLVTQ